MKSDMSSVMWRRMLPRIQWPFILSVLFGTGIVTLLDIFGDDCGGR